MDVSPKTILLHTMHAVTRIENSFVNLKVELGTFLDIEGAIHKLNFGSIKVAAELFNISQPVLR